MFFFNKKYIYLKINIKININIKKIFKFCPES